MPNRLRYDIEQIESANLKAGEEDQLEIERKRLGSSEQLATLLQRRAGNLGR
ncbi:MAG UNVERIFIED_CONTAM: hypothetical protein LVT10_21240 [Anaerolineae bacterium]